MTPETQPFYRGLIAERLAERCRKNPRYSIRAFARASGIDAGTVSKLLSGKQVPTYKMALRIFRALELGPDEQEKFLQSALQSQRLRSLQRVSRALETRSPHFSELNIDLYRVIADWHHFAILELTFIEGFRPNSRWIASELGISPAEAATALTRLVSLGLLQETPDGRLIKSKASHTTAQKTVTTPSLRRNQRQLLEKAIDSLENDPIEERVMTSMTIPADPQRIERARKMIESFNQKICRYLAGGRRTRVYNLGVSLHPLQKRPKGKNP